MWYGRWRLKRTSGRNWQTKVPGSEGLSSEGLTEQNTLGTQSVRCLSSQLGRMNQVIVALIDCHFQSLERTSWMAE